MPRRIVYDVPVDLVRHTIWRDDFRDRFRELPASGVATGEWDLDMVEFADTAFYEALHQHFAAGLPWPETRMDEALELPSIARRCRQEGGLDAYTRFLGGLHDSFREHGYRGGEPVHVLIGRDGGFIRYDGSHRLAMAKITGVTAVPVRVMLRHADWQLTRVAHSGGPRPAVPMHPDLQAMFTAKRRRPFRVALPVPSPDTRLG